MLKLFISSIVSIIEPQNIYITSFPYFHYAALIYYFVVENCEKKPSDITYIIYRLYIYIENYNKSRKFSSYFLIYAFQQICSHDQNPLI